MGSDKHLKLRATPDSALGQVITHLQKGPVNQQELAAATLLARFLPFAMNKDDPQFRETAIRCATDCEAWVKAIREYAELSMDASTSQMTTQSLHPTHYSVAYPDKIDDVDEPETELDPDLDERKERRRKNPLGF